MMRWRVLLATLALTACGSPPPAAYSEQTRQGAAAARQGQHLAAAEHYERAARFAEKQRDADEARYRAAESFARAGANERAAKLYRNLAESARSERRARAAFALAQLWLSTGQEKAGQAALVAAIHQHPDSGLARPALRRHLDYLRSQGGHAAALDFLARERTRLGASELAEALDYAVARELDAAGRTAQARDAYLACARRFPYPQGAYWDDALYRAAEKELELKRYRRAIQLLQELLAEQEPASINGSYERGRYAEGQLLIAHIFRDDLAQPTRARAELRKLWLHHRTSRLVDDALWEEALLARDAADGAGTCEPLRLLVSALPDSRYAACAPLLCPTLAHGAEQRCHDYIRREAGLP